MAAIFAERVLLKADSNHILENRFVLAHLGQETQPRL